MQHYLLDMAIMKNGEKHRPRWQNQFTTALSIVVTFHFVTFGFLIFQENCFKIRGIIMEFKEQVLDLLVEVTENNIVKENPDIELFEEGIIDSFQTVGLLLEIQNKLDIEVSIMDFDRDEWATPNKIAAVLEELR